MTARPWRPEVELDGALERGELDCAITLAAEVAEHQGRPLDLGTALRFLPTVAAKRPGEFDAWALRWLTRWVSETPAPTIGRAAEIACSLADAQREPIALESVRRSLGAPSPTTSAGSESPQNHVILSPGPGPGRRPSSA